MDLGIMLKVQDSGISLSFAPPVHRLGLICPKIGRMMKNSKHYFYTRSLINTEDI
jgi:hypothetical protein